ncbi:MAG: hypothetical protein M3385_05710 [Actinomycetota bacterium]|nr:hypothetical protein [Actinomycetota bacterium]
MGVACPQECGDELARIPVEDQKRVVDVLLEVAVILAFFLIAVSGVSVASKSRRTFSGAPSLPRLTTYSSARALAIR